jgi:hypothetical protein
MIAGRVLVITWAILAPACALIAGWWIGKRRR